MEDQLPSLLKQWRARRGLSLGALAIKSGVHIATLSRWEAGRQPRWAELEAVLEALLVPCAEREDFLKQLDSPQALRRIQHPTGQLPPLRGDLLRALRLRKGLTQSETAHRLNITQGMLAKWEKSEDWPSAERISALCYLMEAREEEMTALRCNRFEPEQTQEDLTWDDMESRLATLLFSSPLSDLGFLALEERLWWQTVRREKDRVLLDYTYAAHARFLADQGRLPEAKAYLDRGGTHYADKRYETIGLNHTMARAAVVSRAGTRPRPERGVEELRASLERTQHLAFRAWMQSEIAKYLLEMGSVESALCFSQEAIEIAERTDRLCEAWFRRLDHATILNRIGRSHEALETVEHMAEEPELQPVGLAIALLLAGVQALLLLKRRSQAQQWLARARGKLDVTPGYLVRPTLPAQAAQLALLLSTA